MTLRPDQKTFTANMKYKTACGIAFAIFTLTPAAYGQYSGKEALEERLQSKLNRILTADEYLIDIKIQPNSSGSNASAPSETFLPGLQVLGPTIQSPGASTESIILGGKADILLILDKKVSGERARVAQDIVRRVIESEGLKNQVKISAQQKDINKVPAPVAPPAPPREATLLEQIIREKDFVARALLVFWGGVVSIMALYFMLRRFLLKDADSAGASAPQAAWSRGSQPTMEVPSAIGSAKPPKTERTRDELYSKDEAFLTTIKEITDEAKVQPPKIARVLSKWAAQTDELARAAALFLRNCDIKTVELVCQAMHPSDLEKVIAHVIEDFEPFGAENHRVIERMRADLAVLASEQIMRDQPDPLKFLKRLSDDDIRNILDGENEETIALVATQLPAHRLQKFYDTLQPDTMKSILARFSSLEKASLHDFEPVSAHLNQKIETLAGNLMSEKDRVNSIHQMIASIASPVLQCEMIFRLHADNEDIFAKVRSSLLVATDLRFLSGRVKNLMIQYIDADTLGTALSDFAISFDQLLEGLPEPYQAVFTDAQSRVYDASVVHNAWKRINNTLQELVSSGLISKTEISATVRRADTPIQQDDGGINNSSSFGDDSSDANSGTSAQSKTGDDRGAA